jgi:hypothetical protein
MTPSFIGRTALMWPGRAAEHVLGLGADGDNDLAAARGFILNGDDRGLVEHDALVAHVDQGVCRTQVDRQITGESNREGV